MPGPKPAYAIMLTDDDAAHLQHLIRAYTTPCALVVRAKIILTAAHHPDWTNQRIATTLATSDRLVRKWRCRWSQTHNLHDAPRPGAPRRFSPCAADASDRTGVQPAAQSGCHLGTLEHQRVGPPSV